MGARWPSTGNDRLATMVLLGVLGSAAAVEGTPTEQQRVIVTSVDGTVATAAAAVARVGGEIHQELALTGGVSATLPAGAVERVQDMASIAAVTQDSSLQLTASGWDDATGVDPNPQTYQGSVNKVASAILQTDRYWMHGHTGAGVDVALIDTGVVPVTGLIWPGKVVNGPDLSWSGLSWG